MCSLKNLVAIGLLPTHKLCCEARKTAHQLNVDVIAILMFTDLILMDDGLSFREIAAPLREVQENCKVDRFLPILPRSSSRRDLARHRQTSLL